MERFHIDSNDGSTARKLAEGISTTIFPGEGAMISVARLEPGAMGTRQSHAEEQ